MILIEIIEIVFIQLKIMNLFTGERFLYRIKYNTCLSFKLRSMDELHALMLYIIIITYRNNVTNFTEISYTKIADIAKMNRNHIRSAISKLVAINLIHVDRKQESHSCSMYRLIGINDYINFFVNLLFK